MCLEGSRLPSECIGGPGGRGSSGFLVGRATACEVGYLSSMSPNWVLSGEPTGKGKEGHASVKTQTKTQQERLKNQGLTSMLVILFSR